MNPLFEQYRPASWEQVIGQSEALSQIEIIKRRGLGGRAFWISGASGTGKTTIARLLARELADDFFIREVDSQDVSGSSLRDIESSLCFSAWGKGGRGLIINEAHGLRSDAIRQLLIILERLRGHVVVIFTTTTAGDVEVRTKSADGKALVSRCIDLRLNCRPPGAAELVQKIAIAEGLDGQPIECYRKLAAECDFNIRAMLQTVESGRMIVSRR